MNKLHVFEQSPRQFFMELPPLYPSEGLNICRLSYYWACLWEKGIGWIQL